MIHLLGVDVTQIGSASARTDFLITVGRTVPKVTEVHVWGEARPSTLVADAVLVVGDLSTLVKTYEQMGAHEWMRRSRSYNLGVCAVLRTKEDLRWADRIDALVLATAGRTIVVQMKPGLDRKAQQEIESFIARFQPTSLFAAKYSPRDDSVSLEFGDGKQILLKWQDLSFIAQLPKLRPETATVSEDGDALQLLDEDGNEVDIDAQVLRSRFVPEELDVIEHVNRKVRRRVGELLRRRRQEAQRTQSELADRTGLDQAVISRIERGQQRPRIDTLEKIARALNLSLAELLTN